MNDFDWLKKQLGIIWDFGQTIADNGSTAGYDSTTGYSNYTALKLIVVHYTADVFARVARHADRRKEGFDGAVYVDLFAGTGLVTLKNTGDVVAGSAPCAIMNKFGFDYSVMVEKDVEKCRHLEKRISKIPNIGDFDVIKGDCNEVIEDVLDKISAKFDNPIILAFVDPEGMEIKFETLMALNDRFPNCDFLINFNTSGITRVVGIAQGYKHNVTQIMKSLFHEDPATLLSDLTERTPLEKFADQVQGILDKKNGDIIPIHADGNRIIYHLLCYTRQTRGGSKYIAAFSTLKERIEKFDKDLVIKALEQMHGKARSLDEFFKLRR